MRDGVELVGDLYLPPRHQEPAGDLPAILERTPYDRRRQDLRLAASLFASRGYAVLVQDCRGRFESGGDFSFYLNPVEHLDGVDTLAWIGEQPWSDGHVGTTGISYGGAIQQALAVERPPELVTQVVLDAGYNYWNQMVRQGGAFSEGVHLPYAFWMARTGQEASADPAVAAALDEALENIDHWLRRAPLKKGASPLALAPTYEAWYMDMARRADYDAVWRNPTSSLEAHIDEFPDIPVCFVTSWYGHHAGGNLHKFAELTRRNHSCVKLVIGCWQHGLEYMESSTAGEVDFGPVAARNLSEFRLRWFDHWMKGIETGLADEPRVEYFIFGGGNGHRSAAGHLAHGGEWRATDEWPPSGGRDWKLFLHPDAGLREEIVDLADSSVTFTFDPSDPVPTIGGSFQDPLGGEQGIMRGGGFDQRSRPELFNCDDDLPLAARHDIVVFRSDPLSAPVEVVGEPVCVLWVSSSAPDTDFTVKLIDEYPPSVDYPAGFALNLSDTIVRLSYRNGARTATPAAAGEVHRLAIVVPPVANRFGRGHRVRLDLSSSNWPRFDVNPNTGDLPPLATARRTAENTILHDRVHDSHLCLPVVASQPQPGGS